MNIPRFSLFSLVLDAYKTASFTRTAVKSAVKHKKPTSHNITKKTATLLQSLFMYGAPDRIRTYGLLIRSQTLYPAELRAHVIMAEGEGFEPSEGDQALNRLAGGSFRPLKHPSKFPYRRYNQLPTNVSLSYPSYLCQYFYADRSHY